MAETDAGERTEEATPRKREEARKKGQVPRSRDLNTALLMLGSAFGLLTLTSPVVSAIGKMTRTVLTPSREVIFEPESLLPLLGTAFAEVFLPLLPLLLLMLIVALVAPIALGGWILNWESAAPKWERLSPLSGVKRMFGVQALAELLKSFAKFAVVGLSSAFMLWSQFGEYMSLGSESMEGSILHGLRLVAWSFLWICASLMLIAAVDVPYQLWNYARQLRMTKQEIRDEYKETEGRPEVKGRIRQMQREIARRRMMQKVPEADVIVTNPEHFAVALKYDPKGPGAPRVIAKGADLIAFQIRKIAGAHKIPIVEAPPLARAIYYTTELDREIPDGLYLAVAQLLAYVYQLRNWQSGRGTRPKMPGEFPIPPDMAH